MNRFETPVLAALILLSLSPLASLGTRPVQATIGCVGTNCCPPGSAVCVPPTPWAPYGPFVNKLQFKYYPGDFSEFNDFSNGQLDLPDGGAVQTGIPPPLWSHYDNFADFVLSQGQPNFFYYGVQFNYGSSTWAAWGCDWQHGNSPCGVEIREAFAHLVDKQRFVTDGPLQGAAVAISDPSPPAKLQPNGQPYASSLQEQCSWDTILAHGNCTSAFNLAPDPGGFAQPGSPDFCAAVDHLIQATVYAPALGLRRDPNAALDQFGNHCGIDPASPGLPNMVAHPMRDVIRTNPPTPRAILGVDFTNAVNLLFAGNNLNHRCQDLLILGGNCGEKVVTCCDPLSFHPTDDWDWYTYAFLAQGPYPDHLYDLYDSEFASNLCGGPLITSPSNYDFLCIPDLDTATSNAATTNDVNLFTQNTLQAFHVFGSHVGDVPIFTPLIRTVALRSMAGIVNAQGVGYPNFWSLLNGHKGDYVPLDSRYQFGGGDPTTLRRGEAFPTDSLNVYDAYFSVDFDVLSEVYDTLFTANPVLPTQVFCWMCNSYTQTVDRSGNTHFLVELRQNLRWQDGGLVDAKDVKFSLLTQRDQSALLFYVLSALLDVKVISTNLLDIVMQGQSVSFLPNLSLVPIVPRHIWELSVDTTYGDVGTVNPSKLDPSYDPVTSGTLIGSGPFICESIFQEDLGRVGTGCAQNSDGTRGGQSLDPGATVILQSYDRTNEPGTVDPFLQWFRTTNAAWGTGSGTATFSGQFQEFSWADKYDNATVTIQDLASVEACFGKTSSAGCADYFYWLRPGFHPGTPGTISSEVVIVLSHLDDTWVYPFSWNGDQSMQPGQQIQGIVPFTP